MKRHILEMDGGLVLGVTVGGQPVALTILPAEPQPEPQRSHAWLARAEREGRILLTALEQHMHKMRGQHDGGTTELLRRAIEKMQREPAKVRGQMKFNIAYRNVAEGIHAQACYSDLEVYRQVYGDEVLKRLLGCHADQGVDPEADDFSGSAEDLETCYTRFVQRGEVEAEWDVEQGWILEGGDYTLNLYEFRGVLRAEDNKFPFTVDDEGLWHGGACYSGLEEMAQAILAAHPGVQDGEGISPLDKSETLENSRADPFTSLSQVKAGKSLIADDPFAPHQVKTRFGPAQVTLAEGGAYSVEWKNIIVNRVEYSYARVDRLVYEEDGEERQVFDATATRVDSKETTNSALSNFKLEAQKAANGWLTPQQLEVWNRR